MRFRKRAEHVDAVRWDGGNVDEVRDFCGMDDEGIVVGDSVAIITGGGTSVAAVGDWVVRDVFGELVVVRGGVFEKMYEAVADES